MSRKNLPTDVFYHIDMKNGDKTQCWPWTGKVNAKDGRPYFTVDGKRRPAYCVVLELYKGEPQKKGELACHTCDNRICCNPHHLYFGSHQDNMNDMVNRERHGLPRTVVRSIKKLIKDGHTHAKIAEMYGISREAVTAINNERTRSSRDVDT